MFQGMCASRGPYINSINHLAGGGQVSYTFPLRITCKQRGGAQEITRGKYWDFKYSCCNSSLLSIYEKCGSTMA